MGRGIRLVGWMDCWWVGAVVDDARHRNTTTGGSWQATAAIIGYACVVGRPTPDRLQPATVCPIRSMRGRPNRSIERLGSLLIGLHRGELGKRGTRGSGSPAVARRRRGLGSHHTARHQPPQNTLVLRRRRSICYVGGSAEAVHDAELDRGVHLPVCVREECFRGEGEEASTKRGAEGRNGRLPSITISDGQSGCGMMMGNGRYGPRA